MKKIFNKIIILPILIVTTFSSSGLSASSSFIKLVSFVDLLLRGNIPDRHFEQYIYQAAYVYDLDPLLLKAIIKHESNFNPYAISYKGAMGLMQLMPETAKFLQVRDPWNPRENIFAGARYYRMLLNRFQGNHYKALLAYHAGPEAVRKGRIPRESRRYARKVLKTWKKYQKQGGVL